MNTGLRKSGSLIFIIFALICGVVILCFSLNAKHTLTTKNMIDIQATITKCEYIGTNHDTETGNTDEYRFTFVYTYGEKEYQGDTIGNKEDTYKIGSKIDIKVDADDPEHWLIGSETTINIAIAAGVICIIASALTAVITVIRKRRRT